VALSRDHALARTGVSPAVTAQLFSEPWATSTGWSILAGAGEPVLRGHRGVGWRAVSRVNTDRSSHRRSSIVSRRSSELTTGWVSVTVATITT
jgi:hypothetical protein